MSNFLNHEIVRENTIFIGGFTVVLAVVTGAAAGPLGAVGVLLTLVPVVAFNEHSRNNVASYATQDELFRGEPGTADEPRIGGGHPTTTEDVLTVSQEEE